MGRLRSALTPMRLVLGNSIFVFLVFLAERFPGERWLPTLMLVYSPQQLWVLPSLLLLALFVRGKRWNYAAGALLVGILGVIVLVGSKPPVSAAGECNLRVLTWNLNRGTAEQAVPEIARTLLPDIICLQEADPWVGKSFDQMMKQPPFQGWNSSVCGELVILSRFPLKRLGTTDSALWVAADVDGKDVVVVCAHLRTPINIEAYRKSGILGSFRDANDLRNRQTDDLVGHLSPDAPTIVCGDLNTPPNSLIYRRLTSNLRDSFDEVGSGFGMTFPTVIPVVRIDHIMVSDGVVPVRCWSPENRASNHLPLAADLRLGG